MTRRLICVVAVVLSSTSNAQPAEFARAARFRADFTYSVDGGHQGDGVNVQYSMSPTGSGFLDPSPPGNGYRASDPYNVAVRLSYVGRAVTIDGSQKECGMQETLVNEGLPGTWTGASCDPAELILNEGGYEFSSNCRTVAVVHSYQWVGDCGQRFDYPEITTWWWEREEVQIQPFPHSGTYAAGATAIQLEGQSTTPLILTQLFTSSSVSVVGTYALRGTLTPVKDGLRLIVGDASAYYDWRPTASPSGPGAPLVLTSKLTLSDGVNAPHRCGFETSNGHSRTLRTNRAPRLTYPRVGPPARIDRIEIFSDVFSSKAQMAPTVAHEMGHGTGLPHHGRGDRHVRLRLGANGSIEEVSSVGAVTQVDEVLDEGGTAWLPSALDPQGEQLILGAWRGESSGEEHCLMRYQADVYAEDVNNRVVRRIYPGVVAPTLFCESNQGTSFNAGDVHPPSRFGPAMVGFDKLRTLIKDPL